MNTIFKLAFRNLWRNKRRTLITAASVMFAAFFAISLSSVRKGIWTNTIDGMLQSYTGHIQIHADGYQENQSIDLLISEPEELMKKLQRDRSVDKMMRRLENFALISTGNKTKGALIAGVDPEEAAQFVENSMFLETGEWIRPGKNEAVVGTDLARNTGQTPGDTLIAISRGYRGNNAVGQFVIRGIADFGNPELNNQLIYIPLDIAREFYAAPDMISSLILTTDDIDKVTETVSRLTSGLEDESLEAITYRELIPSLIEAEALDRISARMILYILYILISFGILGTVMMMVKERQYEFGVLKAVGVRSAQLFKMVFTEILAIGVMGVAAGMIFSYPVVEFFHRHPVRLSDKYQETYERFNMQPLLTAVYSADIFLEQALVVLVMISLISLYPYFSLKNLHPVKAMHS